MYLYENILNAFGCMFQHMGHTHEKEVSFPVNYDWRYFLFDNKTSVRQSVISTLREIILPNILNGMREALKLVFSCFLSSSFLLG